MHCVLDLPVAVAVAVAVAVLRSLLGSFSNDDGDGNQDVKEAIG